VPATRARTTVKLVQRRPDAGSRPIEIEVLAHEAGLHPELVRRLLRLGAVEQVGGTARAPLFPRDAGAQLARMARLRRDLGLNYAGALLAGDLLARIEELEERLSRYEDPTKRSR
jgi:chaperone modulatory protein CbpM